MSGMIERVARAVYFTTRELDDAAFEYEQDAEWTHQWETNREHHERVGRAAIKAMREPTVAMTKHGIDAGFYASMPDWPDVDMFAAEELYTKMVDEALKDIQEDAEKRPWRPHFP